MKQFFNYFLKVTFAIVAMFTVVSCEDEPATEPEVKVNPKVNSIEAGSVATTQTSTSVKINFSEAEQIQYTYYSDLAVPADEDKLWREVAVEENSTSTEVEIESLKVNSAYTFEAYAVNGETKSEIKVYKFSTLPVDAATISLAAEINAEVETVADVVATVKGALSFKYTYYVKDARPEEDDLKWTSVQTDADGDYPFSIEALAGNLESETTYVIEAFALNSVDAESERAMAEVIVAKIHPALTWEIEPTTFGFNASFELNKDLCSAYTFYCGTKEDVADMASGLDSYISYGFLPVHSKSQEIAIPDPLTGGMLSPDTEYSVLIAQLSSTYNEAYGSYSYALVGTPTIETYKTKALEFGVAGCNCAVEIEDITASSAVAAITRDTDGVADKTFYGCMPSSEASDDMEQWIADNAWFGSMDMKYVEYVFLDPYVGDYVTYTDCEAEFSMLTPDTEYTMFSVSMDEDSNLTEVTITEFKTTPLATDNSIKYSIEVTSSPNGIYADIKSTITFEENCDKVYYLFYSGPEIEDGVAKDMLMENVLAQYPQYWAYSDSKNDVLSVTTGWKIQYSDYTLYTLGQSEAGAYSEMQKVSFTTGGTSYDSEATVSAELISVDAESNEYATEYLFAVTMENGAKKYKCGVIKSTDISDINDPVTCGAALLATSSFEPQAKSDAEVKISQYNDAQDVFVFIPMDGASKYGTPTVIKLSDLD